MLVLEGDRLFLALDWDPVLVESRSLRLSLSMGGIEPEVLCGTGFHNIQ